MAGILCLCAQASAKDAKGLWFAGGALGYHTTQDGIASTADDPGDLRPDYLASRETGVDDTLSLGVHAGFGLSRWLLLQVDAGWFEGDIGTVDAWLKDTWPVNTNPLNPISLNGFDTRTESLPFEAGKLRQAPVLISATLRFRPDRLIHPLLSAGAGMVFMKTETSEDSRRLNQRIASMRVTGIVDESGASIVPEAYLPYATDGNIPRLFPLTVKADDSFAWHFTAGLEFEINSSCSLMADLRYTVINEPVRVMLGRHDHIVLSLFPEELFREDGSVRMFNNAGQPPNPPSPFDPRGGRVSCILNTSRDFDFDGHRDDLCYPYIGFGSDDTAGATFLVQGGEIDLSGFQAQVGLRWYF